MILNGCASTRQSVRRDLADRVASIKSIVLVPLEVSVYHLAVKGGLHPQLAVELAETARANLTSAIAEYFDGDGRFTLREVDSSARASAKGEIEQPGSRIALLTVREIDAESPERIRCLPGPTPTLTAATGADALLLLYATDRISTGARKVLTGAFLVGVSLVLPAMLLFPPLWPQALHVLGMAVGGGIDAVSATSYVSDTSSVLLCLVDPRSAEVLWLYFTPVGRRHLMDAADVRELILGAYANFRAASGR
jgi:hypothetical protein